MTSLYLELARGRWEGATVLTLGVFDGVHVGHRHLIEHLKFIGTQEKATPVVVTFANHPATVLRPDAPLPLLATLEDRLALLQSTGIEHVLPITFTRDLSLFTAEEFVLALRETLGMRTIVVGPDFAMGHRRLGTIPVLRTLGTKHGFSVEVVDPLAADGKPVSSTAIRTELAAGNVRGVTRYLNRPYTLTGLVKRGEGRGAGLGFPTANLMTHAGLALPADGVYAGWLIVNDFRYAAAVSIGAKPTFHSAGSQEVEAYALEFDADIYGRKVAIEFVHRIRGQERFSTVNALVDQMHTDVAEVKNFLAEPLVKNGPK